METLERLRHQLDNLGDLHTLVTTMKALSAASIRQYERAEESLRDYYRTIEMGLHVALQDLPAHTVTAATAPGEARLAAILFGSDHGLCGRLNEDLCDYALERLDATATEPGRRRHLVVGARLAASLEHRGHTPIDVHRLPGGAKQITATVQRLLLQIDQWREQEGVHYVYLFYNRHSGGARYHPTGFELLPVNLDRFHRLKQTPWPTRIRPTFNQGRESLLRQLLHQYLFVSLFRACAESQSSEHSSRLATLQTAERNLDDYRQEVTAQYRRARQNLITAELLDIVSGFEALRQGDD
ncbi:F0F1 ATP synthase subunit gamma [Saccharospirillum salsuginis]|uniref:F0F1 ATP synthase subunit gamma n=1 Tax=Saccharospirillum salsuginis TaxID=418750 RepID=A0A918NC87_9GAMM|nr:F0F1 ATP synthase subunit gamma [Saccharospirillum salsuginis]GGX61806.1 F0F1 ATP synthase subunit gamma [Saccharospirillum salsuginis]